MKHISGDVGTVHIQRTPILIGLNLYLLVLTFLEIFSSKFGSSCS